MVSCAGIHGAPNALGQRSEFSQQEKVFYNKAADFYINGKQARTFGEGVEEEEEEEERNCLHIFVTHRS